MHAVVGLGNPGAEYENTRHNAGRMVIAELARRAGGTLKAQKATRTHALSAWIGTPERGQKAVLATCNTYMNVSGGPVKALLSYFGVAPETLVVIHDELDLPFGTLKLKRGGGEGGHNGLKSISQSLATKDYIRLRFGIGRPPGRQDPADYVLRPFPKSDRAELDLLISRAADAVEDVLLDGLERATLRLHSA